MRILFVSQYFPPEMGAPSARVYELAREWRRGGHRVTVLTGFPNHPDGRIPPKYRPRFLRGSCRERVDGIDVVRTWLYPAPNRRPIERILNYCSFFASAALRGMWLDRPDVVIGTSPQLLAPLAALWLARRFGVPFVFEVRDLWPESLPASGIGSTDSALYQILAKLARYLYQSADLIVPVTERFCPTIAGHAPDAQMIVVENGVDTTLFQPHDAAPLRRRLGLESLFVVSYIGTLGYAHGLPFVLEAAAILQRMIPDVRVLLVGDGAERQALEATARQRGLDNVIFTGPLPRTHVPQFISLSDVCLVLLRDSPLFETVLPSKLLEFMSCGAPVVVGVQGLAQSIVQQSNAGIVIAAENVHDLVGAVHRLRADPMLRRRLGRNGRRFIVQHFTRSAKARIYLNALQRLVAA